MSTMEALQKQVSTQIHSLFPHGISQRAVVWACAIGTVGLGATWAVRDYHEWVAFGTGGTPPTPKGYLRITKLRIIRFFRWVTFTKRNQRDPRLLDQEAARTNAPTYLGKLPQREGVRPKIVTRAMPQRQVPEPIPAFIAEEIMSLVGTFQAAHPDLLYIAPSKTEGGTADGLYVQATVPTIRQPDGKKLQLEVAHAHPAEKSLHVCLSPRDAAEVVRKAWGEMFPLEMMPLGWVLLYAPRNAVELETVKKIVAAGIPWMTGVTI